MNAPPLVFQYDGEAMIPRQPKLADRYYTAGETYTLVEHQERSRASHDHFFSCLGEAWGNLPEDQQWRFPTVDSLRKFALIKAGYCDSRAIVASSKAEAQRLAAFIKPMDEFAVVVVTEAVVTVYTAQSQSLRAMGKANFADSKDKVLGIVAEIIGVTPNALTRNSESVA